MSNPRPPRVLTAVPLCDGHDAAITTINREMVRAGVEVVYLGYNRPAGMIARAAVQEDVAAVGISSYNGGHVEFFAEVRRDLDRLGGDRIKLFGGGGGTITPEDIAAMTAQGTDAIFMPGGGLDAINRHIVEHYRPAVPDEPSASQLDHCRAGDNEALGRLMSWVEAGGLPDTRHPAPDTRVIGFTGPGGAGKSTLIDELLGRWLAAHPQGRAAVLSTDPTSPTSGGALLGDRTSLIWANGERVYYRCFAARGHPGGLAACVPAAVEALRGCGFALILVESLGTGQDADPFRTSAGKFVDTAVYVMTPEYGSPIQLDKIAMLETADAVVMNKSDRPSSKTAIAEVSRRVRRSKIPVFPTVACRHRDEGVDKVFGSIIERAVE